MIDALLTAAGVEHAQSRFIQEPAGTYAVYFDDIEVDTADRQTGIPAGARVYHHAVTVEVYEPAPDDAIETAIEAELDARGLPWTKQDRYWLDKAKRYQVIYEFSYTSKS